MKKKIFLVVFFCLFALWPFFKKGYFESHDGEWMVIRFTAFHQTLRAGQIPVRFTDRLNNNYGYPVLNFLYPLPFYLAEIPKIIGFGFVDSIKIIFVISTLASAAAMFWAIRQLFGNWESLSAAILYVYFPYRFVDLYVRGSFGENLAFIFLPLIFGCIIKIEKGLKIFKPVIAFCVTALILSHNIIAALFIPIFIAISFLISKKERISLVTAFFLGIAMSAFFSLPAILDLKYVRLSQIKVSNIEDHLSSIGQLIIPSWGYGPNPQDSFPTQLGIVPIAILISSLALFLREKKKSSIVGLLLSISALCAFLMIKVSSHIWDWIPFLDVIQFPWRLLSVVMFASSILGAYVVSSAANKKLVSVIVIIAAICASILYTLPKDFVNRGDGFYATNEDTTTVRDEYMPLWATVKPEKRADNKIEIQNGQIISQKIKPGNYQLETKTGSNSQVVVNTIYFPGWQVKVDGKVTPINYQNKFGLINFELPEGEHKVIIKYAHSSAHLASEIISIIAILATGVYFLTKWQKRNS